MDGSTNREGSGIRIVLENSKLEKISKAFKLDFPVSNNEAEYEALLTRLKMAKDLDIKAVHVFCSSKLVSTRINAEFEDKEPRMITYLQLAKDLIAHFESFEITQIPRVANSEVDKHGSDKIRNKS